MDVFLIEEMHYCHIQTIGFSFLFFSFYFIILFIIISSNFRSLLFSCRITL